MKRVPRQTVVQLLLGIVFSVFWASASVATKIGLDAAQPFVLALTRFCIASMIMLFISHIALKQPLPKKKQWLPLSIYGLLNISIYLGLFVVALQEVSSGIGSLFAATNPVFMVMMSAIWHKKRIDKIILWSLTCCILGMAITSYPLVQTSQTTLLGISTLLLSTLSFSLGSLYFSSKQWGDLHILTINGWQTLLGGLFLVPFTLWTYDKQSNHYDLLWLSAAGWLAIGVSIIAVQSWLFLLKINATKASFWLFLCPVFGFIMAALIRHEPISIYTYVGVFFVLAGMYLSQIKTLRRVKKD